MKLYILALAVLLTGCAGFEKPAPQIQYVPQIVKVPVPIKCKKQNIAPPTYNFNQASKDGSLYGNLSLLAAENDNLSASNIKLQAALAACSQ